MNIFFIHNDPTKAARLMVDKHIPKMILESAQMLSTAHRVLDAHLATEDIWSSVNLYKATHINHPCAKWIRESVYNYEWLYRHYEQLAGIHLVKSGKEHKSFSDLRHFLKLPPVTIPYTPTITLPPCAMPEDYKIYPQPISFAEVIWNYRNYYTNGKSHLHKWSGPNVQPGWLGEYIK